MVQNKTDDTHLLVSLYNTKGQNFILKLSVVSNVLKVLVTDKASAERWKCAYDSSYIENLTRKTGNFKQFAVFVSMLKAGLLKTNECVYVELLTQEELELRRKKGKIGTSFSQKNRRYLILIYQVEFDKIHYPLPLEYCGKPDPEILQGTIRRLENDVCQIRSEMSQQMVKCKSEFESREFSFQKLISQLNNENKILYEENTRLKKLLSEMQYSDKSSKLVQKLEAQVKHDKAAYTDKIYRLEIENKKLTSILMGRVPRNRAPSKLNHDSITSRSLPRSSSSCHILESGDPPMLRRRGSKKSPSPARKTSISSSERSLAAKKSKTRTGKTGYSSSDGHSSQDHLKKLEKSKKY